jgi:hypothetical protein
LAGSAARPRSTIIATAVDREQLLASAHFSTAAKISAGIRTVIAGSCPVAGLPRPRLFLCTDIDLPINYVYIKSGPAASANSPPTLTKETWMRGSNG